MSQINSIGTQVNRFMDAMGLPDSIGDAIGAIVDLHRGDRTGFVRNMQDLADDVTRFIERRFPRKNFLKSIASKASVPLSKSFGLKRALMLAKPLIKHFTKLRGLALFTPQGIAGTAVLSILMEAAKRAKVRGSGGNQPQMSAQLTQTKDLSSAPLAGSLEEKVMLVLTRGIKENAGELEALLNDIQRVGSKQKLSDKDKNDLQVMQVKLQLAMNRRNEMVNTFSNIVKTLHEMNMAAVRNIRM